MNFFSPTALTLALTASAPLLGCNASAATSNAPLATSTRVCPALLQQNVLRLQDEKSQSLCQYTGKVLVIVNTASFCGFTPQYKSLEALHTQYQSRGLVVLGFPSNDFSQESGSNKDIADFCENTFGVKFPMFTKTAVSGNNASPLFKQLALKSGTTPRWNFYKYIVSRDGSEVIGFSSMTDPAGLAFVAEIEKQLARP